MKRVDKKLKKELDFWLKSEIVCFAISILFSFYSSIFLRCQIPDLIPPLAGAEQGSARSVKIPLLKKGGFKGIISLPHGSLFFRLK
jgi:hypothetical protein